MLWFMSSAPSYKPLATSEDDSESDPELALRRVRTRRFKKLAFHLLAVAAIMYAVFSGVKYLARSLPKMRMPGGAPCNGPRRNLSSLPEHFVLPSGDKIPSVALGTVNMLLHTGFVYLMTLRRVAG